MRLDQRVSQCKYSRELDRLTKHVQILKSWGAFVLNTKYPYVDVAFMPRHSLKFSIPLERAPEGIEIPEGAKRVMAVIEVFPLAARPFGVRVSLDDYDQRAPSVIFCDPWTWDPLSYDKLFRANHVDDSGKASAVLLGDHPVFKRPFLCLRGVREYHEHPQHTGDDWLLYRRHSGLFSTIAAVWKACVLNASPHLIIQPPNINVNWAPAGRI